MNIYTRTGDSGETSLFDGSRVSKDSLKVESYGTIDEVNSFLGLAHSLLKFEDTKEQIKCIQKKLFTIGALLSSDEKGAKKINDKVTDDDIAFLENIIDNYTSKYGKMTSFVTPGETQASASLDIARTITRRAERRIITLSKHELVCPYIIKYVNRLSDVLFALSQEVVNRELVSKNQFL